MIGELFAVWCDLWTIIIYTISVSGAKAPACGNTETAVWRHCLHPKKVREKSCQNTWNHVFLRNVFWSFLHDFNLLNPNPLSARRKSLSNFVQTQKTKMAAKNEKPFKYPSQRTYPTHIGSYIVGISYNKWGNAIITPYEMFFLTVGDTNPRCRPKLPILYCVSHTLLA